MSLRDSISGTGVALVTPFTNDLQVDYIALERLINFVLKGGVEYVVTLGTTGETPVLDSSEKSDIINFTYDRIAGRVPVVVGVGGNNTKEIIEDLNKLPLDKAEAILTASPYYNKPSQEGIFQHYQTLANNTAKPIMAYNVPGRTGSNIAADTTLRLAREVENICGIKEASGNVVQCMKILRDRPKDFVVVSGDDHITLPLIAAGADGVISVAANCFPKDFSEMVRFCLAGDFKVARGLHYKMLEGFDLLFAENNPAGVKGFLAEMGIIEDNLRLPLVRLSAPIRAQIAQYLESNKAMPLA